MKFNMQEDKSCFNSLQLKLLILLTILINMSGFFCPILRNDDPVLYANIAKHIVLSGDWVDLIFNQANWLDKPHLPFWLMAVSFKLFGINSVAYILPGFIFYLLGAYYTYLLAKKLYASSDVGILAVVIYLSAIHLLISSTIDVRAEAYLLGEIMPACYYWYLYYETREIIFKNLLLGAFFTALALMTKGLFVLVTIFSGLITLWLYRKFNDFKRMGFSPIRNDSGVLKWILALLLSFLFIAPEIIALYLQFDSHPNNIVFGHTHVSGIKWFFWGSQFGRFFNTGAIAANNVQPMHYIFFVHTFLWAFLPWSIVFVFVLWVNLRMFKCINPENVKIEKELSIYLLGSFFPTFILFSLTKFQLDHYTNIIMPFAAILCARWLYLRRVKYRGESHPIFYLQIWIAILLTLAVVILSVLIFGHAWLSTIVITSILMLILFIVFMHKDDLTKAILYPVLAINLTFAFIVLINANIDTKYDLGYVAANYLNQKINEPVIDYKADSLTLEFYYKGMYQKVDNLDKLDSIRSPYYLVLKNSDLNVVSDNLDVNLQILTHIQATTIDKVMSNLLAQPRLQEALTDYVIVKVHPK